MRLILFIILTWITGVVSANPLIDKAEPYRAIMLSEINTHFPQLPNYDYLPALISHETCPSAKSYKCWNPQTTFKTTREEGAGLGQLTRVYNSNGTIRFDTLTELRDKYRTQLGELKWSNVRDRPDLQIRAMIFMLRGHYNKYKDVADTTKDLISFMDSAYNGGAGNLDKDRLLCQRAKGCDPSKWFNHVELYSVKSRQALYAGRSPYEINRHHVKDVLLIKMPIFDKFLSSKPVEETIIKPSQPNNLVQPSQSKKSVLYDFLINPISVNEPNCTIVTPCTCVPFSPETYEYQKTPPPEFDKQGGFTKVPSPSWPVTYGETPGTYRYR